MANRKWWELFPNYTVEHLLHSFSDHCLILISTKGYGTNRYGKVGKSFKFNADLCLDKECEMVVQSFWNSSTAILPHKLNNLGVVLMNWSRDNLRKRKAQKIMLESQLADLATADPSNDVILYMIDVRLKLNQEADRE